MPPLLRYHNTGAVAIVELSGGRIACAGDSVDPAVRVWDIEGGAELAALRGHRGGVAAMVVSPDSEVLVSGSADKTLRLWDSSTYAAIATIQTPSPVRSLLRLVDGTTIVSGHDDGVVRLWALATDGRGLEPAGELPGHTGVVRGLAQLPDGRLVSVSYDKTARVWDAVGRCCEAIITVPLELRCCCLTAAGELAIGCQGGRVLVVSDFEWARRRVAVVAWVALRVGYEASGQWC